MVNRLCAQHGDHHQYRPGKRQIRAADGSSYHPTVRDSWVRGLFCLCGAECPPNEEPKVRAALEDTARLRRLVRASGVSGTAAVKWYWDGSYPALTVSVSNGGCRHSGLRRLTGGKIYCPFEWPHSKLTGDIL